MTHEDMVTALQDPRVPPHVRTAAFLIGERIAGERVTLADAIACAADDVSRTDCVLTLVFGFRSEALPISDPELEECVELARLAAEGGD